MSTADPRPFRVLAVEDEPDLRQILKITLRPLEVVTAVNGLDGLMKLDRAQPDFIISDVMMPEMDGWEFVKRARTRPGHDQTPVIFLTALTSREDMKRGYETGANVYLTKPYDPDRLKKNLDVFVEQFGMKPRAKKFTIAEIEQEDKRQEETPRVPARSTIRPQTVDLPDVDPFKLPPPPAKRTPEPPPEPKAEAPKPLPKAAPRPAAKAAQQREGAARILLITAERALATEAQREAGSAGCELVVATESASAMDKIALYLPDAVMLHWQLPEGRAPVLVELISEAPSCKGRPLIVVSDKRLGGGDKRRLENMGVFETMRRPVAAKDLRELLIDLETVCDPSMRASRMAWDEVNRIEAGGVVKGSAEDPDWTD